MGKRNIQNGTQKPKKEKPKPQEDINPFDDIFFWISLAAADFSFGLYRNSTEPEPKIKKQITEEAKN
jgi:hypothetical protein